MNNAPRAIVLSFIIIISFINPVSATVEMTDLFSDFTTSDVTVHSDNDLRGKAVFELLYSGDLVESHEIDVNVKAGEKLEKVIIWREKPRHDYYTVRVSLYEGNTMVTNISNYIAYGTVTLPKFQVVDFSPSNSGVLLLLRSFNPTVTDIKIELLDNNDIVYSKTSEDMSITASSELKLGWPFLLSDKKNYVVRAKIYSHRLNAPALINTYIAGFSATEEVEILPADVTVDEYGASVTIRGKSQVPFDGSIHVTARNRETNSKESYTQQLEDILTSGKESTAGIVWKGMPAGNYDILIEAVNRENNTLDKYETVLRIPEYQVTNTTLPGKSAPGFEGIFIMAIVILVSRRIKGA
ncbi:MAG: hypothetical protein OIN87_05760 [Candidatus Methanoperedens sp.]|nr:hypothetical protein [Candidatus Methanoperedens sp.]